MTLPIFTRPTLLFIGVTTTKSSIMQVFPAWARHLGLDADIAGVDLPVGASVEAYRAVVCRLKDDPMIRGALVTTHKLDVFRACRDLFDGVDPLAALTQETSCLSKRGPRLVASAKDPITAGLALDALCAEARAARGSERVFADTGAACLLLGAGGAATAITWHLMERHPATDRPSRLIVTDRSAHRLDEMRAFHATLGASIPVEYHRVATSADTDRLMTTLPAGSLVINATGLGKDAPGSPLSSAAVFPDNALAFELNYRGDLVFLAQARAQADRGVRATDGWVYFLHGWTRVIAEVFDLDIPTTGPGFDALSVIARHAGQDAAAHGGRDGRNPV
jgi:shikimate 5-dehydrogenase